MIRSWRGIAPKAVDLRSHVVNIVLDGLRHPLRIRGNIHVIGVKAISRLVSANEPLEGCVGSVGLPTCT
ncbi:MAG: hypothetical protein QXX81_01790 [Zestosphaera sp.]